MGGLAYLIGGAMQGVGSGLVKKAEADEVARRDEALARLREENGFTLGVGDVRYDRQGREIARGPSKAPERERIITPEPGGAIYRENPDGSIEMVVAPNDGSRKTGEPVGNNGPAKSTIPSSAIDYLRKNPDVADQFDRKYGAGAANRVLGGAGGNVSSNFPEF